MKYEKVTELFINGKRQGSSSGEIRNVLHPADGHLVATFHEGGAADTVSAIDAARNTFDGTHWPSFSGEQRGKIWNKLPRFWSATKNYSPKLNQKTLQNELLKPATTLMM